MLLKVYCSSFSAVAAGTLDWPMIDILRNKDEYRLNGQYLLSSAINKKRKGNTESIVWKFTMESIVHSIWKEYGNYMLMEIITVLRDNRTRRDLYVFALLRLDIFKDSICIVSSLFGFINFFIFVVNPFGSYSTFVGGDLEYPNSLRYDRSSWSGLRCFNFEQVSNCDGVLLEILMDHKF